MRKRTLLTALLVAVVVGGTTTALAVSGDNSNPAPNGASPRTVVATELSTSPQATRPAPAATVPAGVAASLSVLRRSAGPDDAFPKSGAGLLRDRRANFDLARRVIDGTTPRWLVPEPDDNICLVDASGAGGCQSSASLAQEGTIGTIECGPNVPEGKMLIYGVVPDHVPSVTLTSRTGTATVAVTDNGWETLAIRTPEDGRPFRASWTDNGQTRQLAVPISPDVNQSCG